MRKAAIQELTLEAFGKYGYFANSINPDAVKLGSDVVEFYRDMVPLDLGSEVANVLIILPERTYANDCQVYEIPPADQIEIIGA